MPPITRRTLLANACLAPFALRSSLLFPQTAAETTTISTPAGSLRGELSSGIRIFRGVPFAEPPIGPLRFRPPAPAKPWTGTRDALHFAAPASQPSTSTSSRPSSEDCLYLNVWAPEGKGPFPVYVWIHGGGFTGGTSFDPLTDGTAFARDGIVCVTVAYRLGVFGFLDLAPLLGPPYAGSANNGLRDLIAALTWVQRNSAAFGGDPTRVTVGGESAGAKLTDILMGVPSAQPLFHQMISESGGAERVWPLANATPVAQGFGDLWHARSGSAPATLTNASVSDILATQQAFLQQWPQHFPIRPEIDGTLIPQLPVVTVAAGSTSGKRFLLGTNREESASFIGPHPAHDPTAADLGNLPLAKFNQVFPHYARLYPDLSDEQRRIRAVTAEEYWIPSLRIAEAHVQGGGTAWVYELIYASAAGRLKGYAFHGLELPLAWNKPAPGASDDLPLASALHTAWVTFIKGETPAAASLPPWPAFHPETRSTMLLNTRSTVVDSPQPAEYHLWDGLL